MKSISVGLLAFFILFGSKNVTAQDWNFGLQVGVVNSGETLKTTNLPNELEKSNFEGDRIWGWQLNGFVSRAFGENFQLVAEPGFIRKGFSPNHLEEVGEFKLDYLTIPVLADIRVFGPLRLQLGPEVSYRIGFDSGIEDENYLIDWEDYFEKWDISGLIGMSYDFGPSLAVGLRYSHSITKATRFTIGDAMGQTNVYIDYYNQYLSAVIRYNFNM